jgi:hypothetical protein
MTEVGRHLNEWPPLPGSGTIPGPSLHLNEWPGPLVFGGLAHVNSMSVMIWCKIDEIFK